MASTATCRQCSSSWSRRWAARKGPADDRIAAVINSPAASPRSPCAPRAGWDRSLRQRHRLGARLSSSSSSCSVWAGSGPPSSDGAAVQGRDRRCDGLRDAPHGRAKHGWRKRCPRGPVAPSMGRIPGRSSGRATDRPSGVTCRRGFIGRALLVVGGAALLVRSCRFPQVAPGAVISPVAPAIPAAWSDPAQTPVPDFTRSTRTGTDDRRCRLGHGHRRPRNKPPAST
jgi:hypothetical protein